MSTIEAEPPAYAPPVASDRPKRSIQDLRAQIIANGSAMRPTHRSERASDDHIEVIVAKTPPTAAVPTTRGPTHWNEKQAMMMNKPNGLQEIANVPQLDRAATSASSSARGGLHYAVLIKRSTSGNINIILKGQVKDTPEEALEWMLERTEMLVHDLVVRRGRSADDGCCVM